MNPFIKKIEHLLADDKSEVARVCEAILIKGTPALTSIQLPISNARDIYSKRASLNADTGGPIEGFDDLLSNLNNETASLIGIQWIEVDSEQFAVFTDADVSKLIGILLFSSSKDLTSDKFG